MSRVNLLTQREWKAAEAEQGKRGQGVERMRRKLLRLPGKGLAEIRLMGTHPPTAAGSAPGN